jgi:hypothetical protein
MADLKISQLPAATTPVVGTEVLPIVQSGTTSQVSINSATGITRPFTSGGVVYASSSSALATGSALVFDGTNLGVGTASPFADTGYRSIDIRGSSTGAQINLGTTATRVGQITCDTTNGLTFNTATATPIRFFTDGGERARIDTSGNLGLGVTPSAWATTGTFGKSIQFANYGAVTNINDPSMHLTQNAYWNGTTWVYIATQAAAKFSQFSGQNAWSTAPSGTAGNAITFTQAMTLDASGNLLVGTTSNPNAYRQVLSFNGATTGGLDFLDTFSSAGTTVAANFRRAGTSVGSITTTLTATAYLVASDYRLKTVIGAVSGSGERIDALEPVEYTWNSNGSRTRGFLAHQFQEVYADSVMGTKDAVDADGKPVYQQMQASTSEVIADLVAEIQSLRKRLAALEKV